MKYLYPCQKIWAGYEIYARGASVIRKGFELVGASCITNDSLNLNSTFWRRSESILEHQAKVAWLASAFMSNFPGFFGEQITYIMPLDTWLLITTELCHDVGEIANGDIPDDGNPLHDTKDGAELAVFENFISTYSSNDRELLLATYKSFQKHDSRPALALYALDKTDAVLTQLLLEKHGIFGRISAKDDPTKRDLYYAHQINSDAATDVWGVQLYERLKSSPADITDPIFALLNAASIDVRGEEFSWLQL